MLMVVDLLAVKRSCDLISGLKFASAGRTRRRTNNKMHPLREPSGHANSPLSSYQRLGMLQVGLKLRKFPEWRDVTPPRIGTYTRHTKERRRESSLRFFSSCATQLSLKRAFLK